MEKSNSINYWKYYLLLLLLLAITFNFGIFSNSLKYTSITEESLDKKTELFDLKNSGPQINITTPENKTYYGPMSGYYPATYGFENDEIGEDPEEWNANEVGGTVSVVAEIGDHKNVVDIYKTSQGSGISCFIEQTFPNQTDGIIEFWLRTGSTSKRIHFEVFEDSKKIVSMSLYDNSMLRYHDLGNWYYGFTYSANTWYRVLVDINMDTDTYSFAVYDEDGNLKQSGTDYTLYANNVGNNFNNVYFSAGNFFSGWHNYVDAIGYSWDTDYTSGDNIKEGLLLSYSNTTSLDWIGYSLDGQTNKAIIGNTTIPFPTNDGVHTIQVFGNDSLGTNYHSDVRYFTTNVFNIVTPKNKTYTKPMTGYYPATYGFENDQVGNNPDKWTVDESGGTVNVISNLGGHEKVVEIHDTSSGSTCQVENKFSNTVAGTIELWVRLDSTNKGVNIWIGDEEGPNDIWIDAVRLFFEPDGWIKYQDTILHNIMTYSADYWYHIRVDFDCTPQTFDLYIDNELKVNDGAMSGDASYMDTLNFNTYTPSDNYYVYFDAVGYSWDSDYSLGDNLYEGLLLSYTHKFSLEGVKFSLDGQPTQIILVNTTFPFLSEGVHTIQLFGNNSIGTLYQSDIRYFSIDVNAPTSMISFTPYRVPDIVIRSTAFTITADDGLGSGVSLIRYKINDLSWNTYIGSFNLSTYEYDIYNITYQAIDGVGHIESENTITVTLIPEPSQPGIPGYNLFIMISIIGIITAVIVKKRIK